MCKFLKILHRPTLYYPFLRSFIQILNCFCKYSKYLRDDFAPDDYEFIISKIPYLWAIYTADNKFAGFVFLDNFVGDEKNVFSAELTTCFERDVWGKFTKDCARLFLKKCFEEYGLHKIRASIYPDNFRVSALLKSAGFIYEATLPQETVRNGKLQDIDIYALYQSYYYKNEVKN